MRRLGVLAIVSLLVVGATAEVSPVAAAAPPSSGCGHAREPGTRLRRVTVDGWTRGHAPVKLYEVEGGGHTWPGGPVLPPAIFGPTNQDIDATARILNFFAAI